MSARTTTSLESPRAGSLGRRILQWSLVVALAPMVLLAAQGYHCSREAVLDAALQRLTELAVSKKAVLEEWVAKRLSDVTFLACCPFVRDHGMQLGGGDASTARAQVEEFLGEFADKFGFHEAILLVDGSGRELAGIRSGPRAQAAHDVSAILAAVVATRRPSAGRIHEQAGRRIMHFAAPIMSEDGGSFAALVAVIDTERMLEPFLEDTGGLGVTVRCQLVARDGTLLTDPGPEDRGAPLALRIDSEGLRRGRSGDPGAALYRDHRGADVVGGYAALPPLGWVVLVEQDAAEGLSWLSTLAWRAVVVALTVAAGLIPLSFWIASRLARPLQRMVGVATQVAAGDHDARVEHLSQPEADVIGKALNHMLDELQTARARLVQSATLATVGELTAAVVHEMRNPLSSIKLNLGAIRHRLDDDPKYAELARIAEAQVERLERMLSELLTFGKPLAVRLRPARLRDVVAQATGAVAEEARRLKCEIRVVDEAGDLRLTLDPERVAQALVNLLHNALQAAGESGRIEVRTALAAPDGRRAVIAVADSGPGIPEDNLDRLFQPFFTTKPDGTGLGLAIVRKIVEYHGGRVSAANLRAAGAAVHGAVFRIELPCSARPARASA